MALGMLAAALWFTLFVVVQWGALHFVPIANRARFTLALFAASVCAHLITTVLMLQSAELRETLRSDYAASLFAGVLVMACLFVVYMPFYYTIATSVSVQSLTMIVRAGGSLPLSDLHRTFASHDVLRSRLDIMVVNGYLRRGQDTYSLTAKGRRTALLFSHLKRLWNLGAGG